MRHSHEDIIEPALSDWHAVLEVISDGPFFFGNEPTGVDAIVFAALATTVLTPIESPIADFLKSQPACIAYAERMRARFFPELTVAPAREVAAPGHEEADPIYSQAISDAVGHRVSEREATPWRNLLRSWSINKYVVLAQCEQADRKPSLDFKGLQCRR